jgi:hypothetical protein
VEGGDRGHYYDFPAVQFEHFYGVSPRRFREIFERTIKRKGDDGQLIDYRDGYARPIVDIKIPFYSQLEKFFTRQAMRSLNRTKRDSRVRT